jgi:hypothetical protein
LIGGSARTHACFDALKALNEPVKSVLQCFDVLDKFHINGAAMLLRSLLQARLCLGGPLGFALRPATRRGEPQSRQSLQDPSTDLQTIRA